ncbi:MAG: tRNA pseudouridine(38-40) synthase TruA [Actinomycetaceae bacterium]|nr:tRNA pseudouridine(38-40) synthase TruA [Actinomycetaceae bacterium]
MATVVRLRLTIAYLGTAFHGWAAQPGLRTVQGELETALTTVLRHPVALTVAGRTDAGVHARHQVAHCDIPADALAQITRAGGPSDALVSLCRRVNALTARTADVPGGDVVIRSAQIVDQTFDARFCALTRHYAYQLSDGSTGYNPLQAHTVWWTGDRVLEVNAMEEAANVLVGEHDFLSFCKPREGATTIRTLHKVEIARDNDHIRIALSADAFCHSMVRSIVGALVDIGLRRKKQDWMERLVAEPSRIGAAPVAPAHGLTLIGIDYPPPADWKRQQQKTRRLRTLDR